MPTLTAREFVDKWRHATLKERSASQEHFLDLCHLIGHATPAEADSTGESFAFEVGADKSQGGSGFADVWKKGCFAWEYKGKHADLDKAYQQLLQYREALQNPPLMIVSDIDRIIIHTNFTNSVKQIRTLTLDDLLTSAGLKQLSAIFTNPDFFKAPLTTEDVTREAASEFAKLADQLRKYGAQPQQAAHFLIRLLFCLFAEDAQLLPNEVFTKLIEQTRRKATNFAPLLKQLFNAMAQGAGSARIKSRTSTADCSMMILSSIWTATAWTFWPASANSIGPASNRRSSAHCSCAVSIRRSARNWAHSTPAKKTFC